MPTRWLAQFSFGIQAYALKPFQSVASNARSVVANPHTAATKAERLLANAGLAEQLALVLDQLQVVKPNSYLNCDHSDMNGLTAFVGAIQTRNGRAIPCLVATTYADRLPTPDSSKATPRKNRLRQARAEARQWQSFTGHYVDALQDFHDRLGFWPRLVFDRGFGNETLVTHLAAEGATFYIRLKAGRFVELDGEKTAVRQLHAKDTGIRLYGLTLRVIRSPKVRRCKEPWYILTNDRQSSRNKIVRIYYHRFEIEETFKDVKHIWELRRTRLNKPLSLKVILWFISLGIALLYLASASYIPYRGNPKKRISWLRRAYEQYQQAVTASLLLTG